MNVAGRRMLRISAVAAMIGPPVILISDIIHITAGYSFEWTIGLWAGLLLMIAGTVGIAYYVSSSGGGMTAIIGGCFAFFGLVAGASMQVLFRVHAVLEEQGSMATVEQLKQTLKLVASTQMIGLAWPVGALILAIGTYRAFRTNYILPLIMTVGAISFPIGRIGFNNTAVIVSGIAFTAAYWMFAKRMFAAANSE